MKLTDFVREQALVPELKAGDRDGVVAELVDALVASGDVPASLRDTLVEQILEREKNGSTGFGKGVAVPHVKHDDLPAMSATIGLSDAGVDFNALDKAPVFAVVLLLSPKSKPDEHLQAMENIFANLQKDQFRRFLRQADTREAIMDLLQDADAQRLTG